MGRTEIRLTGFGGQGIILSGYIVGKAAAIHDEKQATFTQSYGPESRGGACSAQVIISDEPISYPHLTDPAILVVMSQAAYNKYAPDLEEGALLIIDQDLVETGEIAGDVKLLSVPATRLAEELGRKIVANIVMLGFFATYIGKWLRRSKVVTGAEWMNVRFGTGPAGQFARTASALLAIVISVAFIGFAEYGCGHFVSKFITSQTSIGQSLESFLPGITLNHKLAIILISITGVYTIAAGLFGVVLTNVIQFCIILVGSVILIAKAVSISDYQTITQQVPPEWFSFIPQWDWQHLANWEISEGFRLFILMSLVWVAKGFFLAAGGPQQLYDMQRFLSARSPREACKAGMLWGAALTPMFMVSAAVGVIGIMKWGGKLTHPEHLYPVVIGTMLPIGIKGLVLAGLLLAVAALALAALNFGETFSFEQL